MSQTGLATLPRGKWSLTHTIPSTATLGDVFTEQFCPVRPVPTLPPSLYPAPSPSPPVIIHIVVPIGLCDTQPFTAISLLAAHTNLTTPYITELVDFGAVYLRIGIPDSRTTPRASRITFQKASTQLPPHTMIYVRVYANPKRHSSPIDPFVFDERDGIVAVFKPPGLPVAAGCDNAQECVLERLRQTGNIVHICTRLDVGTSGVLLCSRNLEDVGRVNGMIADSRKTYVVLCQNAPPKGPVLHLYNKRARLGRGKITEPILKEWQEGPCGAGWVRAELVVLGAVRLVKDGDERWEVAVRLVTGRTHQIRVQFAALGCAVVGDCKYEPVNGKLVHDGEREQDVVLGNDPTRLGLHAKSVCLKIRDEDVVFDVGEGWWRTEGWVGELDAVSRGLENVEIVGRAA